jgi:hypothetical protein
MFSINPITSEFIYLTESGMVFSINSNHLLLHRQLITVLPQNHMKPKNTLCGKILSGANSCYRTLNC